MTTNDTLYRCRPGSHTLYSFAWLRKPGSGEDEKEERLLEEGHGLFCECGGSSAGGVGNSRSLRTAKGASPSWTAGYKLTQHSILS